MNFIEKDDECDINPTPNKGVSKNISNFLKLSLGFGGNIGILVGGN